MVWLAIRLLIKLQVSKNSLKNSSETVESEIQNTGFDREKPKEKYISTEKRQQNIDDLKLI